MVKYQTKNNKLKKEGFLFIRTEKFLNALKSNIFPVKVLDDKSRRKTSPMP